MTYSIIELRGSGVSSRRVVPRLVWRSANSSLLAGVAYPRAAGELIAASRHASGQPILHLGNGDGTVLGQREDRRLSHPTRLQCVLDRAGSRLPAGDDLGEGRHFGTECVSQTVHEE